MYLVLVNDYYNKKEILYSRKKEYVMYVSFEL